MLQYEDVLLRLTPEQAPELGERILRHYMTFHEQTPQFWRLIAWCNLEQIEVHTQGSRVDGPVFEHLRSLYVHAQKQAVYSESVSFEAFIYTITALSFFYFSNMKTMSHTLQWDLSQDHVRERMLNEIMRLCKFNEDQHHD